MEHFVPFFIFLLSALPHAPFSMGLHCMIGVSQSTRDFWRTLDCLFIFTCAVPRGLGLAWFVFGRSWFWVYTVTIVLDWCYCVLSTCVYRRIKDIPKHILARDVSMIVACYLLPILCNTVHEVATIGAGASLCLCIGICMQLYVAMWFYAQHLPERWYPDGRYDLVGNSHQIMHALVVLEYFLEWLFMVHLASTRRAVVH